MKPRLFVLIAAFAAVAMMALAARADDKDKPAPKDDKVWLKNGDRLSGSIVKIVKGKLVFKPTFGGQVKIPLEKVQSLESDRPLKLKLADKTEIEGRIERLEAGGVVVKVGETTKNVDDLTKLKSVTDPAKVPDIWTGNLTLSASVEQGNTREKSARAGLEVEGRWTRRRLNMKGHWNYGEVDGDIDTRDWRTTIQIDQFLTDPLYVYARNINEADDFEDLKYRFTIGGGAGYQFVESDTLNIRAEVGGSWSDEDLENGGDDSGFGTVDGRFKFRYKLTDTWSVGEDLAVFQSVKERMDTRIVSTADLTGKITDDIAVTAQLIWEYDNEPAPGAGRQDVTYLVGITYSFW